MRRNNTQKLADSIGEVLKLKNLEDKLIEFRIIEEWNQLTGKLISRHTKKVQLYNKKLFVTVDSGPVRQEIFYSRQMLISQLNTIMGKEIIEEIILK